MIMTYVDDVEAVAPKTVAEIEAVFADAEFTDLLMAPTACRQEQRSCTDSSQCCNALICVDVGGLSICL